MIDFNVSVPHLKTPHDGDHDDATIRVRQWPSSDLDINDVVVELVETREDGVHYNPLARYHTDGHSFWRMNPGLRDLIRARIQCYTLVQS